MTYRQVLVRMCLVMMRTSPSFIVLIVHYRNQALPKETTSDIDEKDLYSKKLSRRAENADSAETWRPFTKGGS